MTRRTRIKICGIRRPEDALAAARAGADAVGLVFHAAAPRNVSVEQAREVLAALPAFVTPVALFVNPNPAFLRQVVQQHHFRHVQLHGDEPPEYVADLRQLAVIKAVRVDPKDFGASLDQWRAAVREHGLTNLKALVLETAGTAQAGGTGVANDWRTVREHQSRGGFDGLPPIIAAGGLTPQSVGPVVRDVRPWAVDVSSGVEESPGRKSAKKIAAFVAAVQDADSSAR